LYPLSFEAFGISRMNGLIPTIPQVAGGKMMVAALVGTTIAAATFQSRPLFIQGKGWMMQI